MQTQTPLIPKHPLIPRDLSVSCHTTPNLLSLGDIFSSIGERSNDGGFRSAQFPYFRMAAQLKQLKSKACQASQFVSKHGTTYYKQLMEQNKHYVQEPATVEKCNELSKQLFYTRLASLPSRNESLRKELAYVKGLWKNKKDMHVEQAGIAALFGLECFAWFCAGEIVGRGFTFTGYHV